MMMMLRQSLIDKLSDVGSVTNTYEYRVVITGIYNEKENM